ncbi:helix-turn-helix transcriptional regulator [Hymenobacter sp. BT664]|uniref:Helix-turn-helix transcriptional regulator n=1 Tax=Hymenobacter montanus TaxID=2771359 RepID=A0A927BE59_9BACT|nr:helix-turn-helix domain-containing protein [Hymenobacter montanus]MBD2768392.1 helix-turn-helix transcriptional regulator [Hymenobacter montanus]
MKKQYKSLYPRNVAVEQGRPLNYCGIRCCLEVLGGKWKLLIIAELFGGTRRYSVLKRAIPEISEKMLISSLQELEFHAIVVRKVVEAVPPQVEYSLSAYGQSVSPVLETLLGWGEGHISQYSDKIFN